MTKNKIIDDANSAKRLRSVKENAYKLNRRSKYTFITGTWNIRTKKESEELILLLNKLDSFNLNVTG